MTTLADFKRWSFRQKLRNPFAGLRFFQRDNRGKLIIASRHWPHLLCWSWSLSLDWPDGGKSGSHHTWGIHLCKHNNGGGWLVVGPLWIHWQAYDYMGRGNSAPKVDWDAERARRNKEAV